MTGDHVDARINAVSFQDDGKGIGLALNTGLQIMALGPDSARPRGADAQKPEGQNAAVYSGPCSPAETEASKIALLPDGSRMIATCSDGNAHMVRLKEPPVRVCPASSHSPFRQHNNSRRWQWRGHEVRNRQCRRHDNRPVRKDRRRSVLLAGEPGRLERALCRYIRHRAVVARRHTGLRDLRHPSRRDPRRPLCSGRRACSVLDGTGAFVRIRLGETDPESVSRVGAVVPAIDFAIDPTLSAVAFTTKDIDMYDPEVKPPASVDNMLAVVAVPGKDGAQFSCRRSESTKYSAAVFSEVARVPTVYLVKRDRSIEKLALKAGDANGWGPARSACRTPSSPA